MNRKTCSTLVLVFFLVAIPVFAQQGPAEVSNSAVSGSSKALKDLPVDHGNNDKVKKEKNEPKKVDMPDGLAPGAPDPALQKVTINAAGTTSVNNWDGVGIGGSYTPD